MAGKSVTITARVTIDPEQWAEEWGIEPATVKDDAVSYFNEYLRGSYANNNGLVQDIKVQ